MILYLFLFLIESGVSQEIDHRSASNGVELIERLILKGENIFLGPYTSQDAVVLFLVDAMKNKTNIKI